MSRVRGLLPLVLVTAIGIFNGVWVFGPAFKEQQEKKQQTIGSVAVQKPENAEAQVLRKVDESIKGAAETGSAQGQPPILNSGRKS